MTLDISALKAQALADLQSVAGGLSLCRVSRLGVRGQNVKYFEGRYAALSEIERAMLGTTGDVDTIAKQWLALYRKHNGSESESPWQHYAAGGVDALMEAGLLAPTENLDAVSSVQTPVQSPRH